MLEYLKVADEDGFEVAEIYSKTAGPGVSEKEMKRREDARRVAERNRQAANKQKPAQKGPGGNKPFQPQAIPQTTYAPPQPAFQGQQFAAFPGQQFTGLNMPLAFQMPPPVFPPQGPPSFAHPQVPPAAWNAPARPNRPANWKPAKDQCSYCGEKGHWEAQCALKAQ